MTEGACISEDFADRPVQGFHDFTQFHPFATFLTAQWSSSQVLAHSRSKYSALGVKVAAPVGGNKFEESACNRVGEARYTALQQLGAKAAELTVEVIHCGVIVGSQWRRFRGWLKLLLLPGANQSGILLTAGWRTVLTEIVIAAVNRDDCLAGQFVKTVGWRGAETSSGHMRASGLSGNDCPILRLGRTPDRWEVR